MRSTSVQLALAFAGIVCVSFLVASLLIWRTANASAESQIRLQIELEVDAIEHELRSEGPEAAVGAISSRAERPGAFEYWVSDRSGNHLIGDLRELDGPNGWRCIDLEGNTPGAEGADDVLVLTRSLPGGYRISVGADLARVQAAQRALLITMVTIGGLAAMVCLIAGGLIARAALGRLRNLNRTLKRVAAGDIAARYQAAPTAFASDVDRIGQGLNDMLDRIEVLIDSVRRVSRDVAHDLRTPLSHLGQRLDQVKTENDPAARATALEGAQDKVDEIIRMFDTTLRLAELDAGAGKANFAEVNLSEIAARLADAYRLDIEESGRTLTTNLVRYSPVLGDADAIALGISNLIENAIRHTPSGTQIDLSVFSHGDHYILSVSDSGEGIPVEMRKKVLDPFMRLETSRTSKGTGLGLSIVDALARLHDAELTLSDARPGLRVSLAFRSMAARGGDG